MLEKNEEIKNDFNIKMMGHNNIVENIYSNLEKINNDLDTKMFEYERLNKPDIVIEELPKYMDDNYSLQYPKTKPFQRIIGKISVQKF